MHTGFAESHLRCPVCREDRTLELDVTERDEREIREGILRCQHCGAQRPLHRGVAELLVDPPAHVMREEAGLQRFAEMMRNTGWTPEKVRALPDIEDGYWYVQGVSIRQLLQEVAFSPGEALLDVGSNTCWASNFFAARGLDVTALDISLWEMQGLWTADFFIADNSSYFERVHGSMTDMPMASMSFDYVYACEVLHHNDLGGLFRVFREARRVLRPGGRVLVINETLKSWRDRNGVHTEGVAEFEGYEHAHWAWQYLLAAFAAGFTVRLIKPRYHPYFGEGLPSGPPPLRDWRGRLWYALNSRRRGRTLYLAWFYLVKGETGFGMIATKSSRTPRARRFTALRRRSARSG